MRKFKFNLEKVLLMKMHNEDIAKIEYSKVLQEKNMLLQEIENCNNEIYRTQKSIEHCMENNINLSYNAIQVNDMYINSLRKKIEENLERIEYLEPQLKKLELVLKEAIKQRKIVEKLKEKAFEEWKNEYEEEEAENIDEISNNIYLLKEAGYY